MAIDELTDKEFFKLYQENPKVKELVEGIQKKYNVHYSQTKKPNPENVSAATKEAKETVKKLLKPKQSGLEAQTQAVYSGGVYSLFEGIGKLFSNPYLATASVAAALMFFYI